MNKIILFSLLLLSSCLTLEPLKAIDCSECCKQGRAVSKECCIQCNGCTLYADEGVAECKDIPS